MCTVLDVSRSTGQVYWLCIDTPNTIVNRIECRKIKEDGVKSVIMLDLKSDSHTLF